MGNFPYRRDLNLNSDFPKVSFGESLNLLYHIFTLLKKCKLITLRYLLFGKLHIYSNQIAQRFV
jgi:hypothetical protein